MFGFVDEAFVFEALEHTEDLRDSTVKPAGYLTLCQAALILSE